MRPDWQSIRLRKWRRTSSFRGIQLLIKHPVAQILCNSVERLGIVVVDAQTYTKSPPKFLDLSGQSCQTPNCRGARAGTLRTSPVGNQTIRG